VFLILDQPAWFFWFEVSLLNVLLLFLIKRQENMSHSLVHDVRQPEVAVS
jgi:hypothetical protein